LFSFFPNPSDAWRASPSSLLRAGITEPVALKFCVWRKEIDAEKLIARLEQDKIAVLFTTDPQYPQLLRASADPAEILFVRGTLTERPAVALVGTRHMTAYGRECVTRLVPGLVQAGLATVSGLALGIDGLVHQETLNHHGVTVAFLGTGVDEASIYPRAHLKLAHRMIDEGGAVVSEFPPKSTGLQYHFPMRNRLIASFTNATVVVEAAKESGSLITARCALEENREVLAVPGPIWSNQAEGANHLLKAGAKVCTETQDILDALSIDSPELVTKARTLLPLDPLEEQLLKIMIEPLHVDELQRRLDLDTPTISSRLAMLEMKGLVKSLGGQSWIKSG